MPCAFCDATRDLNTCDWMVFRFRSAHYYDVKIGDRVRRYADRDRSIPRDGNRCWEIKTGKRPPATVVSKEAYPPRNPGLSYQWEPYNYKIELRMRGAKSSRSRTVIVRSTSRVLIERPFPCGVVCCADCRCERGTGATCCRDHWRSWEQVA